MWHVWGKLKVQRWLRGGGGAEGKRRRSRRRQKADSRAAGWEATDIIWVRARRLDRTVNIGWVQSERFLDWVTNGWVSTERAACAAVTAIVNVVVTLLHYCYFILYRMYQLSTSAVIIYTITQNATVCLHFISVPNFRRPAVADR
jgi:hypothetical protein